MERNIFLNKENYFGFYEKICNDNELSKQYPLVVKEIQNICQIINSKIEEINSDNFFELHAEILGYDSRLQIILSLLPKSSTERLSYSLTEKEIIDFSQKDYKYFFNECCDCDEYTNSLFFSII
ncbi:DUF7006 family protein [Enterococcus hirae]|uniref:DUF7006 family protein n=1 Tax=Enterococcus hirae TaxID=1354 RepID=UPI001A963E62|nr:hypothetical protein [Enterococcus hirae]MBO1135009.1 hypothetical protein [Enterococcus hirae]